MRPRRSAVATLRPAVATLDLRTARPEDRSHKTVDPFYLTPEYRAWRDEVIKRANGTCEAPGCGRREPRMFADHRVERRDGGAPYDLANGQCLCGSCHTTKT